MKQIIMLAVALFLTIAARASEGKPILDTLVVTTTPQMHCENCEKKIKQNIRFVKGVKRIDISVEEQRVTIIYDKAKATYDDFVKAFQRIGYEICVPKQEDTAPETGNSGCHRGGSCCGKGN